MAKKFRFTLPILVAFLFIGLLLASPCFAQGSLAVTNGDGKMVGWLLGKVPSTEHIQLLTPQGYVLTFQYKGYIKKA